MKVKKEWKNKSGIYKINCKERCYIGSTLNLYERLAQHISHLRKNKHHSSFMQRCFNKYGEEEFNIEILEIAERNISILRDLELRYIKFYKSEFNSTTPIEYKHSEEMKEKIRQTLIKKYESGEIINSRLNIGRKVTVYDYCGNYLTGPVFTENATIFMKMSNRSVINNNLRLGKPIINKKFIVIPENGNFEMLFNWIQKRNGLDITLYKVYKDNSIIKCTSISRKRVLDKVLNSENFMYYSKKNKCYYTFIGLINKVPFMQEIV